MRYVITLTQFEAFNPNLVGRKFVSLARAHLSGLPVPEAVAVSSEAHDYYLKHGQTPPGLGEEITTAAGNLELKKGLAVRSSAVREDLESRSFAGQYLSFLNVNNVDDLWDKTQKCWLSASQDRLKSYIQATSREEYIGPDSLMGVILQKMVPALCAGVAFSRNPVYPVRDEVVAEGVQGLGESLLSGEKTPYRVFIQRQDKIRVENDSIQSSSELPLTDEQWIKIAGMAKELEAKNGWPQDIEWAMDKEKKIWLLQTRAISTLSREDLEIPPGMWTRKIANDLWADRLSPFMAAVMKQNAPRFDFSRMANFLGLKMNTPSLAVIHGFLYLNCENIKKASQLIPRGLRTQEVRSLFPPQFSIDSVPAPNFLRLAVTVLQGALLTLFIPAANPFLCPVLTRWRIKRMQKKIQGSQNVPVINISGRRQRMSSALGILGRIQSINKWPYTYATLLTWMLRWLVLDKGAGEYKDFLQILSSSRGQNVTASIQKELRDQANNIKNRPELYELFAYREPDQIIKLAPPEFQKWLDSFMKRYGCRSKHRTLLQPRWQEAPEQVAGILKGLVQEREKEKRPDKTADIQAGFIHRAAIVTVGRMAGRYLDLREDLRFLLDQDLFFIRQVLLALDRELGLNNRIFFLEPEEIERTIQGVISTTVAADLAEQRSGKISKQTAPTYYLDGKPEEEVSEAGQFLKGVGTSPGRAVGKARIVHDPAAANMQKDDILVARNTDPAWTPILSSVSAMAVEEGGLLNHCSIVARELGIPAVVGIPGLMHKVEEGSIITVNGDLGYVSLEQENE